MAAPAGETCLKLAAAGEAEGLFEFLDQRPRVQTVEQVDVPGGPAQDFKGQFAIAHECRGGFLVRVGAVAEGELLHAVAGVLLAEEV